MMKQLFLFIPILLTTISARAGHIQCKPYPYDHRYESVLEGIDTGIEGWRNISYRMRRFEEVYPPQRREQLAASLGGSRITNVVDQIEKMVYGSNAKPKLLARNKAEAQALCSFIIEALDGYDIQRENEIVEQRRTCGERRDGGNFTSDDYRELYHALNLVSSTNSCFNPTLSVKGQGEIPQRSHQPLWCEVWISPNANTSTLKVDWGAGTFGSGTLTLTGVRSGLTAQQYLHGHGEHKGLLEIAESMGFCEFKGVKKSLNAAKQLLARPSRMRSLK